MQFSSVRLVSFRFISFRYHSIDHSTFHFSCVFFLRALVTCSMVLLVMCQRTFLLVSINRNDIYGNSKNKCIKICQVYGGLNDEVYYAHVFCAYPHAPRAQTHIHNIKLYGIRRNSQSCIIFVMHVFNAFHWYAAAVVIVGAVIGSCYHHHLSPALSFSLYPSCSSPSYFCHGERGIDAIISNVYLNFHNKNENK